MATSSRLIGWCGPRCRGRSRCANTAQGLFGLEVGVKLSLAHPAHAARRMARVGMSGGCTGHDSVLSESVDGIATTQKLGAALTTSSVQMQVKTLGWIGGVGPCSKTLFRLADCSSHLACGDVLQVKDAGTSKLHAYRTQSRPHYWAEPGNPSPSVQCQFLCKQRCERSRKPAAGTLCGLSPFCSQLQGPNLDAAGAQPPPKRRYALKCRSAPCPSPRFSSSRPRL